VRKKGVNKVVQSTEEVNDKFKALEKAHQDLQGAHQRALAFGEMMSQLCQGNLGTKGTLEEWELIGKGSSTSTEKLDSNSTDISQSSESRAQALELENEKLLSDYEYSKECVQWYKADNESYQKRLDASLEKVANLETQKQSQTDLLKEERRCNKISMQLLQKEVLKKEVELNKLRKLLEKRSPNAKQKDAETQTSTTPCTIEQFTDTLGLEWGVSAGTQATEPADIPLAIVKGAAAMLQKDILAAGLKFGRLLPLNDAGME
jgi:hypothetical protein